ncbi:MAG: hypothetical protein PX637_20590, partial [Microcystis sp. M53601_WE4]|nr:hypothetical protein [Microcystis sp. M53601_WE4]
YLSKPKKSFHLSPTPKGSGYTDTSINHDAVLAELITNPTLKTRSLLPHFPIFFSIPFKQDLLGSTRVLGRQINQYFCLLPFSTGP